jgi:hypothetical protein
MSGDLDLFAYLPPARFAISAQQPLSIATPRIERPVATEPTQGRGGFLKTYDVTEGPSIRRIHVRTKREAWALDALIAAGSLGCTPIDNPAPRWSAYVFKLKKNHGLIIQTINEPHGGPFKGTHGRYVLRSIVKAATSDGGGT